MKPFQSTPERRRFAVWYGYGNLIIDAHTSGEIIITHLGLPVAKFAPQIPVDTAAVRIAQWVKKNPFEWNSLFREHWENVAYTGNPYADQRPAPPVVGVPLGMEQGRLI